jgi:phosphohistidine phosphatase SixA
MQPLTQLRCWYRLSILMLIALSLLSCGTRAFTRESSKLEGLKFIVVRHAEKQTVEDSGAHFDAKDPALSAFGLQRAAALAAVLRDADLVAIYATPFLRTQATAAPSAQAFALPITRYEANLDIAQFVATLRLQHQKGAVLIVGHSNTVPLIVQALCSCVAPMLADSDYGDRFEIAIDASAKPTLQQLRFDVE